MSLVTIGQAAYPVLLAAQLDGITPYMHLYTNDPTLDANIVREDFYPAVFEGYAPKPMRRHTPPELSFGVAYSFYDPVTFDYTTGPPPATIRGYIVTDGLEGPLLFAWRRPDAAFPLGPSAPRLVVSVTARFPLAVVS